MLQGRHRVPHFHITTDLKTTKRITPRQRACRQVVTTHPTNDSLR